MSPQAPTQTEGSASQAVEVPGNIRAAQSVGAASGSSASPHFQSLLHRAVAYQSATALLGLAVLLLGSLGSGGLHTAPDWKPPAVAGTIATLCVALGAWAAWRALKPARAVEQQLHRFVLSPAIAAEAVVPSDGVTPLETGWNRLVRHLRCSEEAHGLSQRLEAAMLKYRQRQGEQILNALTDGIAVTDADQRIICANNALYSILHLNPESEVLLGDWIELALAREAGIAPGTNILDPAHLRHRVVREIVCPRGDSSCTLRVCRTPLAAEHNSAQGGFVWCVRDVTQQKLADKMRDQFVNAATHELRTPMANIKAYAETLALGEVDDVEQQKMFCNVINDEVTRLARFIDDLLHLSRMEVGATTLQLQVTDMGRLLEETAAKVRPQMVQKNLRFEMELPGKLPELIVDKDKLAVAVINLLGNAAKYTPGGGSVQMRVSLPKDAIQIDVEDTGIGIAAEEIPKVLEKFYRSSDPRVYGETGSGLGLSLAQEIVRLHGGTLSVASELDKGSRFTIVLPVTAE